MSELDVSSRHVNEYLVDVILCFEQSETLKKPFLMFPRYIEKKINSTPNILIDICESESSFSISARGVVDSENNIILKSFIESLNENRSIFIDLSEGSLTFDLSVYIWSLKASDTPQLDFNNEILKLFSDIGINLSLVIYTYDPD